MSNSDKFPSSPPGLTRWSMLMCGTTQPIQSFVPSLRRMDCRIKSGNDEVRKEKEAERRQTQYFMTRTQAACGAHQRKSGLRRPPLAGALACRRSTTALARGTIHPQSSVRARLHGMQRPRGGLYAADAAPTRSDAPRTPVLVPAGMMPGPPGSGLMRPRPRAPHLPLSARHHPVRRPFRASFDSLSL
jgi:hypothetical protein